MKMYPEANDPNMKSTPQINTPPFKKQKELKFIMM